MPRELATRAERPNLGPEVHVLALAGDGKGFCGGYDLVMSAAGRMVDGASDEGSDPRAPTGSLTQGRRFRCERNFV